MQLTPNFSQERALGHIDFWFKRTTTRVFRLGGLAGTGKTAMLGMVPEHLGLSFSDVHYCAPTNKARQNLQTRLMLDNIMNKVTTIHSFVLNTREIHCTECPVAQPNANHLTLCHVVGNRSRCDCDLEHTAKRVTSPPKLVIVDEASMVDEQLYDELLSVETSKILFVGDHGQLPPVQGELNLMEKPDFELMEIQRQCEDSPIITLAYQARNYGKVDYGRHSDDVIKIHYDDDQLEDLVDEKSFQAITYFRNPQPNPYNLTTMQINKMFRETLGLGPDPEVGDKVIAVKTHRKHQIPKGTPGTIESLRYVGGPLYQAVISHSATDRDFNGVIDARQFSTNGDIRGSRYETWNYGYCLTCHEAQGSEFESVVVFEPTDYFREAEKYDYRRWLYTAITRAKSQLIVIG